MGISAREKKQQAALAATEFLHDEMILGVGTGSTVDALLDLLPSWSRRLRGAVSSSEASSRRLHDLGIPLLDLNEVEKLELYIDGADEATRDRCLIKGGGAALTREKIIAAAASRFVCVIDDSKLVDRLGAFPVPVEVIPMARKLVANGLMKLGGRPVWRQNVVTDNGNHILDVHGLDIAAPHLMEAAINQLVGVVTVGLFAERPADLLLIGGPGGVTRV